jgi:hypothetical protein
MNLNGNLENHLSNLNFDEPTKQDIADILYVISQVSKEAVNDDCEIARVGIRHALSLYSHFKIYSDNASNFNLNWLNDINDRLEVQCVGQEWNNKHWIIYSEQFNAEGFKSWVKGAPVYSSKYQEEESKSFKTDLFLSSQWIKRNLKGEAKNGANCIHYSAGDPYLQSYFVSKSAKQSVAWVSSNLSSDISKLYKPIHFYERKKLLLNFQKDISSNYALLILHLMPSFALENYSSYKNIVEDLVISWPQFNFHIDSGWNGDPTFFLIGKIKKIPTYGMQHGGGFYHFSLFNNFLERREYDNFYYFWPKGPGVLNYRYDRRVATLLASMLLSLYAEIKQLRFLRSIFVLFKGSARITAFIIRDFFREIISFINIKRPLIIASDHLTSPANIVLNSLQLDVGFLCRFHPIDEANVKKNEILNFYFHPNSFYQKEPRIETILWKWRYSFVVVNSYEVTILMKLFLGENNFLLLLSDEQINFYRKNLSRGPSEFFIKLIKNKFILTEESVKSMSHNEMYELAKSCKNFCKKENKSILFEIFKNE